MKRSIAIVVLFCLFTACAPRAKEGTDTTSEQNSVTVESEGWDRIGEDTTMITEENYPRIDGSTSTLNIVRSIYTNFIGANGENIPESASKTVPSYQKLIAGEVDLIVVPYASAEVLAEANTAGVTLEFYPIAAEALVFITPVDNTTENITREQVRSIYLNYGIENWKELNGPDKTLIPICRNADSGSQSQMDNLILEQQDMDSRIKDNYVELTMEGMLEQVAFYHNGGLSGTPINGYALGYTLYTYLENMNSITGIGEHLKILSFDSVKPTLETIGNGSYPLSDAYYAVVRSDLPKENTAWTILAWLKTKAGIREIEKMGYVSCVK
ncbi:MAG: phosphate ABC transporter permease [Lachnospiraceae bacterium]|nr:phosphate ABC transporter permease [Lachnospiraceae bacterium]